MLRALTEAAKRFRGEEKLPPTGYKPKYPRWIVNLGQGSVYLEGPYTRRDVRSFFAPDRQRSGRASETNLKPYLLLDDARYALGKAEPGKEEEAKLLHRGFVSLLEKAYQETSLVELATILDFLRSPEPENVRKQVRPKDLIAFQVEGRDPAQAREVQEFWSRYLAQELVGEPAYCGVCGGQVAVVRTLPREVVILGQKCQITSFNLGAFRSFGKQQTANSPICFECAGSAIDALDYLTRNEPYRRPLINDPQAARGLENQLAVFWLRQPSKVRLGETVYDLESLLGAPLEYMQDRDGPPPELSQLQALLALPWSGRKEAINITPNHFYLMVISANKGRLAVREWLSIGLDHLKENLEAFIQALRIGGPWGTQPMLFSIPVLLDALKAEDPNLTRGLLRTAYLGYIPPQGLLEDALQRFRVPKTLQDARALHPLSAVLKLALTYGKEEAKTMETLDEQRNLPAYLCGRLLSILEEAQQRASRRNLNSTIVDRFYVAASTAPAANLAMLLNRAQTMHLPKVRKEHLGYGEIQSLLEEVLTRLDTAGGFPQVLSLPEQADFALGFYHQRASFRKSDSVTTIQTEDQKETSDAH